ncbi:MAG: hypothetical protein IAF38_08550, partial [Bacteroidia bacterium]|nr:hypothetical protein [Bacteroidia bacterium]
MDIELIKQGLKEILNEDISNRTSIADLRRNVFVHSSKAEEKETQISVKESRISELSSDVSYLKNQLSLKDKALEEKAGSFNAERSSLLETISQKETEITALKGGLDKLNEEIKSFAGKSAEVNKLSLENNHYAEKIREMVAHIEKQQAEEERLKKEANSYKSKAEWGDKFKKELEELKAKGSAEVIALKKQIEEITANSSTEISSLLKKIEQTNLQHEETVAVLKDEIVSLESLGAQHEETIGVLKD